MVNFLKTIWLNRRHFKMQIFGITVLIVVAIFVANLLSIKVSYDNNIALYMSTAVKHTSSFQMSLSGITGTVNQIYISNDKTKCFMRLSFGNSSTVTLDAWQYQALLTNTNSDGAFVGTPVENITGEIYMFGTTGSVGIYLKSDVPFENTMKKLTLRSFKKYTTNTKPYFQTMASDAQYDQCHIYFNPGGTSGSSIAFLEEHVDGVDFNASEIHKQVVIADEERNLRSDISDCYSDMEGLINRIGEYQARLTKNYGLAIPALPQYIEGDSFKTIEVLNETGAVVSSYRRFVPNTIIPGGVEYDWYNGSLKKGYYNLVPNKNGIDAREYILQLGANKARPNMLRVEVKDWYYADGTPVTFNESLQTAYEQQMKSTMDAYVALLQSYVDTKFEYQTGYLVDLLTLELNAETVGQAYTVRKDVNAVLKY